MFGKSEILDRLAAIEQRLEQLESKLDSVSREEAEITRPLPCSNWP